MKMQRMSADWDTPVGTVARRTSLSRAAEPAIQLLSGDGDTINN